ncbi:MAG: hypothetical protein ACYDEI_00040 [Erysipelotrichaceae bacterium]
MKQTIRFAHFYDGFESRRNNFSYEGLKALFDYFMDFEEETGEELEFDPIAICCDYTEYENLEELQNNYNDIETMEDAQEHTIVILIPDTERFIIQNY